MNGGSGGNAPNSGNGGSGGVGGSGGNPARPKLNLDILPAGQTPNALGDQLSQQLPPPAGVMPTQYPMQPGYVPQYPQPQSQPIHQPQQFPVLPAGQYTNPPFYGQPGSAYPQPGYPQAVHQPIQQPIHQPSSSAGQQQPTEESTLKPGVKMFGQSFGLSFGLTMGVVTVFILFPMLLCGGCTALMIGMGAVGGVAERVSDQSRESEEIRREWERQQREVDEANRVGAGQ